GRDERMRRECAGNHSGSGDVGDSHDERDADTVVERGDVRLGSETCDCGMETAGGVGRNRITDHRGELLNGGIEIVGEIVEARNEIALDEVEALADDRGLLMIGVVEIQIGEMKFELES